MPHPTRPSTTSNVIMMKHIIDSDNAADCASSWEFINYQARQSSGMPEGGADLLVGPYVGSRQQVSALRRRTIHQDIESGDETKWRDSSPD